MVSDFRKLGETELPLSTSFTNSLRKVADPTRETLIEFVEAVLTAELADALAQASTGVNALDGTVVKQKIDFDPSRAIVSESHISFPLLAVYSQAGTLSEWTIGQYQRERTWNIEYILPDLALFDKARIHTFLNAIEVAIMTALQNNRHPGYGDGYSVFDWNYVAVDPVSSASGLWEVAQEGQAEFLEFPTVRVVATSNEVVTDQTAYDIFSEFEFTVSGDGYTADDIDGYELYSYLDT